MTKIITAMAANRPAMSITIFVDATNGCQRCGPSHWNRHGPPGETVVFLCHFKDLQNPRQPGKISYPLDDILLLCLLAVLAGAECFNEIGLFGVKKFELLRRFRLFGTARRRTIILATLDAEKFQA